MTSHSHKRIRILTGQHAGASLDLDTGHHSTGPDHDCDIAITDWTFAPLQISVGEGGEVVAQWADTTPAVAGLATAATTGTGTGTGPKPLPTQQHRFSDFQPHAFGDIVLCVGPLDQAWPTDLQLLDSTFQPTPQRVVRWAGTRLRASATSVLAGAGVLSLCVMGSVLMMEAPKASKPVETAASVVARVEHAIQQSGLAGLKVEGDGATTPGVLVSGMVATAEQARRLNSAIASVVTALPVTQRVSLATDVAESIRSTVGLAGAEVKYVGDRVFAFTGETPDAKAVRQAIDRVTVDLGDAVRRIEVTLEQGDKKPVEVPILSSMNDGEISVVQTRDGVKHLVVTEPENTVSVNTALSLRPPGATTSNLRR
jgi:type III secretion protein D